MSVIGKRYAMALFGSLNEDEKKVVSEDLNMVQNTLISHGELQMLMRSPIIKTEKKRAILCDLFETKISKKALNLLNQMLEKNRGAFLTSMINEFNVFYDNELGIQNAKVYSNSKISNTNLSELSIKLEKRFKKKIRIEVIEDKKLIGGLKIRIGDTQIDASISNKLKKLRAHLLEN